MKIPVYKTEGIIVGRFNSNEWDRLLIVYTKEKGKILVKAKSVRKKEAKLKETLELFNHIHLMLAHGKNIDTVVGATISSGFPVIRTHLPSLSATYYISELVDKLIVAPERDEQIWDLLTKAFSFLEEKECNPQTIQKLLERFEARLLEELGHPVDASRLNRLDFIQNLCGERIESSSFLNSVLGKANSQELGE